MDDNNKELIFDNDYIYKYIYDENKKNNYYKKNIVYSILSNIFYSLFLIKLKIYNRYFSKKFTIHIFFLWINVTIFTIGLIFSYSQKKIKIYKKNKQINSFDYMLLFLIFFINYFELYFLINILKSIRLVFGVLFSNNVIFIISLIIKLYNRFLLEYLLKFIFCLFIIFINIKNEFEFKDLILRKGVYSAIKYSLAFCIFKTISHCLKKKIYIKNLDKYNYWLGFINSIIALIFGCKNFQINNIYNILFSILTGIIFYLSLYFQKTIEKLFLSNFLSFSSITNILISLSFSYFFEAINILDLLSAAFFIYIIALNDLYYYKEKKDVNNNEISKKPLKKIYKKANEYSLEKVEIFEIIRPKDWKKDINIINLNPINLSINEYNALSLNNKNNYKPLHFASYFGDEKSVIQILNQDKKEIDVKSKNGYTPLFLAVNNNNYNIVKILINNGANKNIENKEGKKPIDIAKDKKKLNFEILKILGNEENNKENSPIKDIIDCEISEKIPINKDNLSVIEPKGLININGTCYMNTVLQCFFHVKDLTKYFIDNHEKNNNYFDDFPLSKAYLSVVLGLKNKNNSNSFCPELFRNQIIEINNDYDSYGSDPKDVVLDFLFTIHKEINGDNSFELNNKLNKLDKFEVFKYYKGEEERTSSIISTLFGFCKQTTNVCSLCSEKSYDFIYEFYIIFSLENTYENIKKKKITQ